MYVPADATVYAAANTTAQISAADVEARVVHATELLVAVVRCAWCCRAESGILEASALHIYIMLVA